MNHADIGGEKSSRGTGVRPVSPQHSPFALRAICESKVQEKNDPPQKMY